MRRCKRIRRAERRKILCRFPPVGVRRFRRDLPVARAQEFPEGRGRRILKFGFGKNEVKLGERRSFEFPARGVRGSLRVICRVSAALPRKNAGRCGKTAKTFQCGAGRLKAGRAPPCMRNAAYSAFARIGFGRQSDGRFGADEPAVIGGFASGGGGAAWRGVAARSSPVCRCAADISRNPGKDARKPAFRGLSAAVVFAFFFGLAEARRIFPPRRAGRGKCVAGVFGAGGGGIPVARFPFSG